MSEPRRVLVPPRRIERWLANFATRHDEARLSLVSGQLQVRGSDGAVAYVEPPFGHACSSPTAEDLLAATVPPDRWAVLLVRKGGFAVGLLEGQDLVSSKVGRRHVQGRTKAGGQSQQRFARRRDQQTRTAYRAAAHHAEQILLPARCRPDVVVCGGDRAAISAVLAEPRLRDLAAVRDSRWLDVPDPRRDVLERAVLDAQSALVTVHDP